MPVPSSSGFEDASGLLEAVVDHVDDQRGDKFGLQSIDELLGHNSLCEARSSSWDEGIGQDVVLGSFLGKRVGESDQSCLS